MGKDPSEIRQDIEETRAQLGETAEAIGHKVDVPARAKEAVSERVSTPATVLPGATSIRARSARPW